MRVEAIHLGAPMTPENWTVDSVRAFAGKGRADILNDGTIHVGDEIS